MTQEKQELIIALVGGVGVDFDNVCSILEKEFKSLDCDVFQIKISELADKIKETKIKNTGEAERIAKYMDTCNKLRKKNHAIMAMLSIIRICELRNTNKQITVYILNSIKRLEEYKLLRQVYGRNFILISVNTSEEKRKDNIKYKSNLNGLIEKDDEIKNLIDRDNYEKNEKFGQDVSSTFPVGHFFVNTEKGLEKDVERFVDILFGHPFHTPTIDERNMFIATGMMYRSADLSRQVGVVITDDEGDIIATGCNDVPKFGGGFYEPNDAKDSRDFRDDRQEDKNAIEKIQLIKDTLEKIEIHNKKLFVPNELKKFLKDIRKKYTNLDALDMQLTGIQEFGRAVHAEMAAICDAAQRGVSLKDKILYCTTYPCHICAKHILNVGIKRVVYIEPYPKSKATTLFDEAISTSPEEKNKLVFEPFVGIAPRRYMFLFKKNNRKGDDKIKILDSKRTSEIKYLDKRNIVDYILREQCVLNGLKELFEGIPNSLIKSIDSALRKMKKNLKDQEKLYCKELISKK